MFHSSAVATAVLDERDHQRLKELVTQTRQIDLLQAFCKRGGQGGQHGQL